jgi:hypothetical protein
MGIEQCISEHGVLLRLVRLISNDTAVSADRRNSRLLPQIKKAAVYAAFRELRDTFWCRAEVISGLSLSEQQACSPEGLLV